jgi:hypothetical protein
MIRQGILVSTLWWFGTLDSVAEDPVKPVVVVADRATASMLLPVWGDAELRVLIDEDHETFDMVNERALQLRHATHFVYHSGQESILAAMVRERLQMQGAIAVDIKDFVAWRHSDKRHPRGVTLVSIRPFLSRGH